MITPHARAGGLLATVGLALLLCHESRAADWPMFGRDATRNPVSPEKHPPTDWQIRSRDGNLAAPAAAKNIKWEAKLGDHAIGSPVVTEGLVWLCTDNEGHRDPGHLEEGGVLMCFNESDGAFRWQHVTPRDPAGRVHDWPGSSSASPPLVEGRRIWFMTNRWEVLCLDIGPLLDGTPGGEPRQVWKLDLQRDLGVYAKCPVMAFNVRCTIGASYKGMIYVITGNGVDETYQHLPAPDAPSLVCLDKETGKVLWKDNSPGRNILETQCASPLVMEVNGRGIVVAPQGDGWVRAFDAASGRPVWQFDANPKSSVYPQSRNLLMAPPVLYDGRLYIATGHDMSHGEGPAILWCIDPTKAGDVSEELDDGPATTAPVNTGWRGGAARRGKPNPNSAVVWKFDRIKDAKGRVTFPNQMHRASGSVAVADGLVIAADCAGLVHCLDARTGQRLWVHDCETSIYGAPLICDGKVYVAAEDGNVHVFALARSYEPIAQHDMESTIMSSPVFANGVLYVATRDRVYAIAGNDAPPRNPATAPAGATNAAKASGDTGHRGLDAVYVATPQDVVERMLQLAKVTKDDLVYDLGCGDGRIVVTAAKTYGCRAAGYDLDPECVRQSQENARRAGVSDRVEIARRDVFSLDLSQATVVTLYLGADVNRRLLPQLRQLPAGARIVSHQFDLPGCAPDKIIELESGDDHAPHTLYLWTTPLKVKE